MSPEGASVDGQPDNSGWRSSIRAGCSVLCSKRGDADRAALPPHADCPSLRVLMEGVIDFSSADRGPASSRCRLPERLSDAEPRTTAGEADRMCSSPAASAGRGSG